MSEFRDLIDRAIADVRPRPYTLEIFHDRRHRARVRQRVSAGVVAAAIAIAGLTMIVWPAARPDVAPATPPRNGAVVFLGPAGLYTVRADGTGYGVLHRDTEPPTPCPVEGANCPATTSPEWSPDGSRLAFLSGLAPGGAIRGEQALFVMNADGGNLRMVAVCGGASGRGSCDAPSWSPTGSQIAVSSSGALDVVDIASGRRTPIAGCQRCTHIGPAAAPSWSPDGSSIAFTDGRSVFTVRSDGSDPVRVTEARSASEIAWSPDGRRLAFSAEDGVVVVGLDGADRRVLAIGDRTLEVSHPAWSPDGRRLAYARTRYGREAEIRVLELARGSTSIVYRRECCIEVVEGPVWSPDGTHLAFSEREIDDPSTGNWVVLMRSDGARVQRFPGWGTPTWQGVGR